MDRRTYARIVDAISRYGARDCLPLLLRDFPRVDGKTLANIESQTYQLKMKRTHSYHHATHTVERYYRDYLRRATDDRDDTLLTIADEVDLSPALFAKLILERRLVERDGEGGTAKSTVTRFMRQPALLDDARLAANVYACVVNDSHYGPVADCARHSIGHAYEELLKRELTARHVSFIDEERMRDDGYDKTPDVKLEVPIAVDGVVVNWIESKASFGDDASHGNYAREQFWSYWNRFGSGMVIYWFGYIDDLDSNRDRGIVLKDRFPDDVVVMNPDLKSRS